LLRHPPQSPLFPYTTLFRSIGLVQQAGGSDNDAVATATALTAETIARALERWTPLPNGPEIELVISGGGARNPVLVELLAEDGRSEEHTSELQSRGHLVCRL